MLKTRFFPVFFVAALLLFTACHSSKNVAGHRTDSLTATALKPVGRTRITPANGLELISSAVHFSVRFQGTACTVYATLPAGQDHNYLQYSLDGAYQARMRISGGAAQPLLFSAPHSGAHTLTIYKATEAHTGPIFIQKIKAHAIQAIVPTSAPLIEFIGNSITCGAAADASAIPCGAGVYHDQHNAYMAYGPRVARALNLNFLISGVSGIGVYRNWNSDGPAMPQVYEKIDFQETGIDNWNFATYNPQVVSIALGTNDFSTGDGKQPRLPFDSTLFVSQYIRFVQSVQSKYPGAQIALLSSPMLNGNARTLLQNCITAVKGAVDAQQSDRKPLALYFFQPMQAHGCSGHPSVEDHAVLATELIPFFKNLMSK